MTKTVEAFAMDSEEDIRRFNEFFGRKGFVIGEDLLGSPVLYVDHSKMQKGRRNERNAGRHKSYSAAFEKEVIALCEAGLGPTEISIAKGCSKAYVSKLIQKQRERNNRMKKLKKRQSLG